MKIKITPDARDRLKDIKSRYGKTTAKKITEYTKGLTLNPRKGASVSKMLDIESPYHFLHISQYYIFYRFDEEIIYITDIYHEKENFLQRMFGINLRTDESIDHWGE